MLTFLGDTKISQMLSWLLIVFILAYSISMLCILYKAFRTPNASPEPQVSDEHMHADVHGVLVSQPDGNMVVGVAV